MELTGSNLAILFTGLDAVFSNWINTYNPAFKPEDVATKITSGTEVTTFPFSSFAPALRPWVGDRTLKALSLHQVSITPEHLESTFELNADKIADDQYGYFQNGIQNLAHSAVKHYELVTARAIEAVQFRSGAAINSFDNVGFYSASHPVDMYDPTVTDTAGSATWANLYTSTALTYDNYRTVRAAMRSRVGSNGLVMGVTPDTLIVPPALEGIALQILHSEYVGVQTINGATQAGTNSNIWKGSAKVVVVPQLSSSTTWYLADTSSPTKPLVLVERQAPKLVALYGDTDYAKFTRNSYLVGVDCRVGATPMIPHYISKCTA